MSASDKFGLGYGNYMFDGILSYENEVLQSVFFNKESNTDDNTLYDRFAKPDGMHDVPPRMTGNYMPSGPDVEIDESQYSYGLKTPQSSEFETRTSDVDSCESNPSVENPDCLPLPVETEPTVVSTPKVWTDAPIIEEYESDDECVSTLSSDQEPPRENVKDHKICSQNPKVNQKNLNGSKSTRMGLGYGNTRKGCYVCCSFSHLIRDCDFHEKRMAKQAAMNKNMSKSVNQKENMPNRNNVHKDDPQRALKNKGIVNSGCSRHMTSNKGYLVDYQYFNGGPVAFGGSKGQITGKENLVPSEGLTCLIAKATTDESNKWHRRLGHVNFKNLNKLMKGNLVRGLPSKIFQNDHTCVAYQKGKQHKAACKAKVVSSISQPLQLLHMDLFGPTSVRSINHTTYFLVITDDFSRFNWVFFLRTKDETSGILKDFIRQIENQLNKKVKTIRCDNGTEFKNREMIELCGLKGIKREYSNARTPQQNRVAERKNRTLIEAARTMLADSFLPNTFWAEAVSTACYVLNRVLVTKLQNKTPYALITGKLPIISYIRPFGCHVTILNTIDHLGKFEEKVDEGFLVGYSLNCKAFRPVTTENRANKTTGPEEANHYAGTQDSPVAGTTELNDESPQEHCILPIWSSYNTTIKSLEVQSSGKELNEDVVLKRHEDLEEQASAAKATSTNKLSTGGPSVCTASPILSTDRPPVSTASLIISTDEPNPYEDDSQIPALEDIDNNPSDGIFSNASYDDEGAVADFTNLETTMNVSPIPTSRIHTIHPTTQILRDPSSAVQTRSKVSKSSGSYAFVDAMQEELLQLKIQKVWILVDLPKGKKTIRLKWVYRNKKDERGVVVRNKARLVAQGHRQEEGIDYDEVFTPVARIEAIRIFLAFASYMGFTVYQMDVKSAFLYRTIYEEVYVTQPPGFIDPMYPKIVYKVVKALYGLHQAPKAWYATLSNFLLKNGYRKGVIDKTLFIKKDKKDIILVKFQMSSMGELTFFLGLQVKQKEGGIFISQDKYVAKILKKFDYMNVKTTSTPIETQRPLTKDEEATDVDVHFYRSIIGSLMYLTASRPDIMFTVCNCSRFQVTLKTSHLSAVKRIFRYLKGKPNLGLWYPKVLPFDLEAYSDSDYVGANLNKKSTTGGCQFLGRRLISWQYKKQIIVATSTTKAEYVAAASYRGQVLWIQN
ncbi:putative ribonuclease H-like domain-containing protein [Tanacetum coccineum]